MINGVSVYFYIIIFYLFLFYNTSSFSENIHNYSIAFIKNNISVCLFLPSAVDDFPFVQGIINSVDNFWPKDIGRKIHWIDSFKGKLPFKYNDDWTIIRSFTPNISVAVMKQQYNSYISYKYCSADKYIAMIDSDSVFISYVKYDILFSKNNTPFILYTLKIRDKRWDPRKIMKTNNSEWGDVMFTYPIIVKTIHVEETLHYIESIHKTSLVKLMENYIFGQFGTFLEYIHIRKYEEQYTLINVEENPFPPRCTIHIPYSYIEVNWGKTQRIKIAKHKNINQMNRLIFYLINQGECAEKIKLCKNFDESKFKKNSYTIEAKYNHYYKDNLSIKI